GARADRLRRAARKADAVGALLGRGAGCAHRERVAARTTRVELPRRAYGTRRTIDVGRANPGAAPASAHAGVAVRSGRARGVEKAHAGNVVVAERRLAGAVDRVHRRAHGLGMVRAVGRPARAARLTGMQEAEHVPKLVDEDALDVAVAVAAAREDPALV